MKKIFYLLLGLSLFLGSTTLVNAKTVTFSEVANKYKEKYDFNKLDELLGEFLQAMEDSSTVTVTDNEIITTGKNDNKEYTATFKYENNLITYNYRGSKTYSEDSVAQTFYDNMAIMKLIYVIAELKGYDPSTFVDLDINEESLTLEQNGIEMSMFKMEYKEEGVNISTTSPDTLKIDLNKFNLTGNNNSNSSVISTPETPSKTTPENPQTGSSHYVIPALILFFSLLTIIKLTKKNFIAKI